jgi:hypothetical protein
MVVMNLRVVLHSEGVTLKNLLPSIRGTPNRTLLALSNLSQLSKYYNVYIIKTLYEVDLRV